MRGSSTSWTQTARTVSSKAKKFATLACCLASPQDTAFWQPAIGVWRPGCGAGVVQNMRWLQLSLHLLQQLLRLLLQLQLQLGECQRCVMCHSFKLFGSFSHPVGQADIIRWRSSHAVPIRSTAYLSFGRYFRLPHSKITRPCIFCFTIDSQISGTDRKTATKVLLSRVASLSKCQQCMVPAFFGSISRLSLWFGQGSSQGHILNNGCADIAQPTVTLTVLVSQQRAHSLCQTLTRFLTYRIP